MKPSSLIVFVCLLLASIAKADGTYEMTISGAVQGQIQLSVGVPYPCIQSEQGDAPIFSATGEFQGLSIHLLNGDTGSAGCMNGVLVANPMPAVVWFIGDYVTLSDSNGPEFTAGSDTYILTKPGTPLPDGQMFNLFDATTHVTTDTNLFVTLVPTPEPPTWILMSIGFLSVGLIYVSRSRQRHLYQTCA